MVKKSLRLKKLSRRKLSRRKLSRKKKQNGGVKINYDLLYNPPHHPIKERLVSKETNQKGQPLLELQISDKTLTLKFIRSNPPNYTFQSLLNDVFCYATLKNCTTIELEDDAMFSQGDCVFRAVAYRVFQNKASIYVEKGFEPIGGIENLMNYKDIIYNFTIENAKNMIPLFSQFESSPIVKKFIENLNSIDISKNNDKFGEWLISNDCEFYREIFNRLAILTSSSYIVKTLSVESLNPATKEFLTSFNKYILLHKSLEREPEQLPGCSPTTPKS